MSLGGEREPVIGCKEAWPKEAIHVVDRMWSGGAREHYAKFQVIAHIKARSKVLITSGTSKKNKLI